MTTLVIGRIGWAERAVAGALGRGARTGRGLASSATETSLRRFPAAAWNESQEANLFVLDRLRGGTRWADAVGAAARGAGVDAVLLDRRLAQAFVLTWGRRCAMLRVCLTAVEGPVRLVSDLPRPLLRALLPEFGGRVTAARAAAWPLRLAAAVDDTARLIGRHLLRLARLIRLTALPGAPAEPRPYVAWLHALPAETRHDGPGKASVPELLLEARARTGAAVDLVVQGAPGAAGPEVAYRQTLPPLRYRPSALRLVRAVAAQLVRAAADATRAADFRHRTLIAPALFDVPAFRLWFAADPPAAVLYPNHVIGNEPVAALLGPAAPRSTMVFYSANVSYRPAPGVAAPFGAPTPIEPEMRFIVADRLTMWSEEMAAAFAAAGYAAPRLPVTGPIVFGRGRGFAPTSRYAGGAGEGAVRIGMFEVTPVSPAVRVEQGYGQLLYTPEYLDRFFADAAAAARTCFGDRFVFVRKIKRALAPHHRGGLDLAGLAAPVRTREPDDSLWRVLEDVDVVLCMPFTSVAFVADHVGIPAAYYDPEGAAQRSPLGGRAPVLRGREALVEWLNNPGRPSPRGAAAEAAAAMLAAALGAPGEGTAAAAAAVRLQRHVIHT